MKMTVVFIMTAMTLTTAENVKHGEALYLKAQCQRCHLQGKNFDPNSVSKEGKVSKVKDIRGIHNWVESCDNFFEIRWFPEEQDLVSRYLNAVYYHFKK